MGPGIVIIDNSCYRHLVDPKKLARFRANLRAADWIGQPSEVNLLECGAAQPDGLRARLFEAIRATRETRPLLPWPFQLLRDIGNAILEGRLEFVVPPSGKEWYLDDRAASAEISDDVRAFNLEQETLFRSLHSNNRRKIQNKMRARGMKDTFGSARAFLDREWRGSDIRRVFAGAAWSAFGLQGEPPMEAIDDCEAWQLFLDGEGAAVYEHVIAKVQPGRVGRFDMLQLVYLALARRRLIVTEDVDLLRVAREILPGRYLNARACHIAEMVA